MMNIPKSLEFHIVLARLAAKTVSSAGERAALSLKPKSNRQEVLLMMQKTQEAETLLIARPTYPVRSFSEIDGELARMRAGANLSAGEILRAVSVFKAAKVSQPLKLDDATELIPYLARQLFYDDTLIRRVDDCIISEEEIADDASVELQRIRRAIRKENEFIKEKLQSMIRSQGDSKYLQDSIITQRNGRYVVPVKAEYKGSVSGIVHEKSASGATLFIEPTSVVEANNRIRELEAAQQQEIARILAEISAFMRSFITEFETDIVILTELDLLFAKASLALEMNAAPVVFGENNEIEIHAGRHPLIDAKKVVPVSLNIKNGIHTLIITGPNTGGKTVTLKLAGLFCVMAQSGLFIPAKSPVRLPIFDGVFADIGDEQSIEQSLSTFSAHMQNIIFAIQKANQNSFILLDELGAGTDPQEGSAIAQAVLTELSSKGCVVIATTHIGELKAFANEHEGFENASMEFELSTLTPTYHLLMGVAGRSNAIMISKKLGLPQNVVELAQGYMNKEHLAYNKLIENAEKSQSKAQKALEEASEILETAQKQKEKMEQETQNIQQKRKKILEQANEKAIEILNDAKETVEGVIQESKKLNRQEESVRTKTVKVVRDKIEDKKQYIEKHKRLQKKMRTLDADEIRVGQTVLILSMDVPATVIELPNSKGMVNLQAGVLKVQQHISELSPIDDLPEKKEIRRTSRIDLNSRRIVSPQIDLHGKAVDESVFELDKYLDDAFLSGLSEVTIIHGRGTGVLRKGVQAYLHNHPHVKSFRAGVYGEGDIGVTIVTLK